MTKRLSDARVKLLAEDGVAAAVAPWDDVIKMARELRALRNGAPDAKDAENARLRAALERAIDCLKDMLMGDDGQAWKETEKALPGIETALSGTSDPLAEVRAEARRAASLVASVASASMPQWEIAKGYSIEEIGPLARTACAKGGE